MISCCSIYFRAEFISLVLKGYRYYVMKWRKSIPNFEVTMHHSELDISGISSVMVRNLQCGIHLIAFIRIKRWKFATTHGRQALRCAVIWSIAGWTGSPALTSISVGGSTEANKLRNLALSVWWIGTGQLGYCFLDIFERRITPAVWYFSRAGRIDMFMEFFFNWTCNEKVRCGIKYREKIPLYPLQYWLTVMSRNKPLVRVCRKAIHMFR